MMMMRSQSIISRRIVPIQDSITRTMGGPSNCLEEGRWNFEIENATYKSDDVHIVGGLFFP